MTHRPRARRLACCAAAAAAAGLCGCGVSNPNAVTQPAAATTTATTTTVGVASAAALTPAQINRQDRPSRALLRRQRSAAAERPMLSALPITTRGVTIAIAGLAGDGRTTLLAVRSRHGRAHALAVYTRQLRRYDDDGDAYRPVFTR